jgi:hypothetical protein
MDLLQMPPPMPPVDIRLTHSEAQLLLAMMQNPLPGESDDIRKVRENLFNTLRAGLSR